MIFERAYAGLLAQVPQAYAFVVATRRGKAGVGGKVDAADPVAVASQAEHKAL